MRYVKLVARGHTGSAEAGEQTQFLVVEGISRECDIKVTMC